MIILKRNLFVYLKVVVVVFVLFCFVLFVSLSLYRIKNQLRYKKFLISANTQDVMFKM